VQNEEDKDKEKKKSCDTCAYVGVAFCDKCKDFSLWYPGDNNSDEEKKR